MGEEFFEGERVKILKPDERIKYSRVEYGYVVKIDEEKGKVLVEFNYKFIKNLEWFTYEELVQA